MPEHPLTKPFRPCVSPAGRIGWAYSERGALLRRGEARVTIPPLPVGGKEANAMHFKGKSSMRHTSILLGLATLCLAVSAGTAAAEVVTWSFEGVVDGIFDFDDVLDDGLTTGAALHVIVSFDTDNARLEHVS